MSFIKNIFGKSKEEITLLDIKEFFSTQQEETSVLEFKSGEVEPEGIYKEIAAFLNTEGGLLIIGTPKEIKKKIGGNEIKICEGELTYSKIKNKDILYSKIASNIVPFPTNISIVEFVTENGNIFLVDVPQSLDPPHQCTSDGKYYIRMERDAKPAPHGLIKALFNKRKIAILDSDVKIVPSNKTNIDKIEIIIRNTSRIPAEKVSYLIINNWYFNGTIRFCKK